MRVSDRAEESHRKGAKDAKETAKGPNRCQSSIGSGSDPSASMEPLANSIVDSSEITMLYKTAWPPWPPGIWLGESGAGEGEGGRPRVRIFGSGSPVEIRLFGFSPEGGTSMPVCVSHRIWGAINP